MEPSIDSWVCIVGGSQENVNSSGGGIETSGVPANRQLLGRINFLIGGGGEIQPIGAVGSYE